MLNADHATARALGRAGGPAPALCGSGSGLGAKSAVSHPSAGAIATVDAAIGNTDRLPVCNFQNEARAPRVGVCARVWGDAGIWVGVFVVVCVCVLVSVCARARACVYVCTRACVRACVRVGARVRACVRVCLRVFVRFVCARAYMP